jgi:ubiquinone/menaquinone biosynthesis C-methylase UbiE
VDAHGSAARRTVKLRFLLLDGLKLPPYGWWGNLWKTALNASDNMDDATVVGFGKEWAAYDQSQFKGDEYEFVFDAYFSIFPFNELTPNSEGFDLGCGSGRWAAGVAPRVGQLHCIDPASEALEVAKNRLAGEPNVQFHLASVSNIPLADSSQDFGYSLGVLHHIPDTARALKDCVRKLRPGAPFLLYIYYDIENRPTWFRAIWGVSDGLRRIIRRLPFGLRKTVTTVIAMLAYWPLARTSLVAERLGKDPSNMPLSSYRHLSFYVMRTDALDRFGTSLEQRFTRDQIEEMMRNAGLEKIRFRNKEPYWVACGKRESGPETRTRVG